MTRLQPAQLSRMQARTISSGFTFMYKVLIPALWIPLIGACTIALWMNVMRGPGGAPPGEAIKWICLVGWIAASVFFLRLAMRLKRVRIGPNGLYISNYIREILVPFDSIRDVRFIRWDRGSPITLLFRDATAFGNSVMFLPTVDWSVRNWTKPHPVIAELKQLAGIG